jgi:hypothetical protein
MKSKSKHTIKANRNKQLTWLIVEWNGAMAAYILAQATKAKHNHVINEWIHIKTSNRKKMLPRSTAMQRGIQTIQIKRREGAAMMAGAAVMEGWFGLWQHLWRRCRECRGVSRRVRASTVQRRAQTSRLERRRHRNDGRCCGDG